MDRGNTEELFKLLAHLRIRPGLFTGNGYEPKKVNVFLLGLRLGLHFAGYDFWSIYFLTVIEKRGWKNETAGLIPQMKKAGFSKKEIIEELVDIHVEIYKLGFNTKS